MKYEDPPELTKSGVESAIQRDDEEELLSIPIAVSLYEADAEWAENICLSLSAHPDANVRGNAVPGFGHLARRFGKLNQEIVQPVIEKALNDPDDFVRSQAASAADDVVFFLKWKLSGR